MAKKRSTGSSNITITPKFNSNGNAVGWFVSDGKYTLTFKTLQAAQAGLHRSIRVRVQEGHNTTAAVYNSRGQLVAKAKYTAYTGEASQISVPPLKTTQSAKKAPAKSAKKAPLPKPKAKAKAAKKAPAAEKTPTKFGRAAYHRFLKRAAKAGYSLAQTSTKWTAYKKGGKSIASLIPPKAKAKKAPATKFGREAYQDFKWRAAKGGYTSEQVSKKWAIYKEGNKSVESLLPLKGKTSAKTKAKAASKPKEAAKTPTKFGRAAWHRFKKRGNKAGYTKVQVSAKWTAYKKGGKSVASLLSPKTSAKAASKPKAKTSAKPKAKKAKATQARSTATALPRPKKK